MHSYIHIAAFMPTGDDAGGLALASKDLMWIETPQDFNLRLLHQT